MTVLGPRRSIAERIDEEDVAVEELARSHRHVERVNTWLGGHRALRIHLRDLRERAAARVLDVGAGNGSTLLDLRSRAPDAGGAWRLVGAEIHPDTARIARSRTRGIGGVHVVRADGARLPFPSDAFDVAVSVLTLHHFDDDGVRTVLREMGRVARERVVANDLERCLPNYAGARLLAATIWRRDPLTRHDGPASVLRSFTPDELRSAGEEAGLRDVRVGRHFPFRLVLDARPPPGTSESGRPRRLSPGRRSTGSVP